MPLAAARKAAPLALFGVFFSVCSLHILKSPGAHQAAGAGLFLIIGCLITLAPAAVYIWARHVVHVITDHRLLTVSGRHGQRITSRRFQTITSLDLAPTGDGRGNLTLGVGTDSDGDPNYITWAGVEKAAEAAELLVS